MDIQKNKVKTNYDIYEKDKFYRIANLNQNILGLIQGDSDNAHSVRGGQFSPEYNPYVDYRKVNQKSHYNTQKERKPQKATIIPSQYYPNPSFLLRSKESYKHYPDWISNLYYKFLPFYNDEYNLDKYKGENVWQTKQDLLSNDGKQFVEGFYSKPLFVSSVIVIAILITLLFLTQRRK